MLYSVMISDLRFHGIISPLEFFVHVGGANLYNPYFYKEKPSGISFFSKGNELTISNQKIHFKGTGGSFCEYMFGVEKPLSDLNKKEVSNRLVMFGAFLDENEKIIFTNETEGKESLNHIFLNGHAVKNYFFFVSSEQTVEIKKRQKQILRAVGRFLKRTTLLSEDRDTELLNGFLSELNEKNSTVFIFKIIHIGNLNFYKTFKKLYSPKKYLTHDDEVYIEDIVKKYAIDRYQQERIKIDIMYRYPDNKRVVDEYRDILLSGISKGSFHNSEFARLRRLRTLGIRNNIPIVLFDTLDNLLLKRMKVKEAEEPEYLKESRAILQGLFFKDPSLRKHVIDREDIIKLLKAKQTAYSKGDKAFEQILLDTVKACDEVSREKNDFNIFEEFTSIITYFDRYDNVYSLLSRLAFTEDITITEDSLRSLVGNKREFDKLDEKLFDYLFIKKLLNNKYITAYGKLKIKTISKGIKKIISGDASLKDVIKDLKNIQYNERLYHLIYISIKERIKSFIPGVETKKGKDKLREDISKELTEKSKVKEIPKQLFDKVFLDIRKESFYLNNLLPLIIKNKDTSLREDFINNSGLDRFHIEILENEYFEKKGFDMSLLEVIREDSDLIYSGGGERI